jgi:integrase
MPAGLRSPCVSLPAAPRGRNPGSGRQVARWSACGRYSDAVAGALREHKTFQDAEQKAAGQLWHPGDWVFTRPNGKPIDPRADHDAWKRLLKEAGVRDARLHDARHMAATMLLVLGVPTRARSMAGA